MLMVAYALLLGAWFIATPASNAPDEPFHYIKTVAMGRGDFFGQPTSVVALNATDPLAIATTKKLTRSFYMPAGLEVPASWFCMIQQRRAAAACVYETPVGPSRGGRQPSYVARYQPYPYLLAALGTTFATDRLTALMLARLGIALASVPFLIAAIWLVWDGTALSELGLVVAATPMVLFTSVILSPSGPEICAGLCVLAAIIRISQDRDLGRGFWAALTLSAMMLATARALGLLWILLDTGILIWLAGMPRLRQVTAKHRRAAVLSVTGLALASAASIAWQLAVPAVGFTVPRISSRAVIDAVAYLPETFAESIGLFGWQNTEMPRYGYVLWGLLSIGIITVALLRGKNRERRLVDVLLVGSAVVVIGLSVVVFAPLGYQVQGRYTLPFGISIPLVAGEVVRRRRWTFRPGRLRSAVALAFVIAGAVQMLGWYTNAHRGAVGADGSWWFVYTSQWAPYGGWLPSFCAAAAGAVALAAFGYFGGDPSVGVQAVPALEKPSGRGLRSAE